jgi:chromosome segregation ATPase
MYEDEHASFLRRENALNERVNEMRKNELASRLVIEQMQRKLAHIEGNYNTLKQTVESSSTDDNTTQLVALMESYQEMSLQFDTLMQQLTSKSQEIQTLIQSRAETEKRAEEQIKQMENIVRRERAEADGARNRVAEMEENHLNLGKAYRDLNERFIRMREQNPSLRTNPAKTDSPAAEESSRGQPKIRLSRR